MAITFQLLFTCTLFLISFVFTNGDIQEKVTSNISNTIFVDPSNQMDFSKIQAAIDSVPSNNNKWVTIFVKAGVYNEKVTIPVDKQFIYLKGEGIGVTSVVWGDYDSMFDSATFTSMADNIAASGITFINSHNYPPNKNVNQVKPAVAARISGDKSAFYQCSFLGYQDTLLDDAGRHFFNLCNIEGAIDFIFGGGQSIYQSCTISVNIDMIDHGLAGFITAQGRGSPDHTNGFIFKQCNVNGVGKAFLGRAWKGYSRVVFYDTFLSDIIVPLGWDAWFYAGQESQLTYAEAGCRGPGSNMSGRVKWEKNLSSEELNLLTGNQYIDDGGWMETLPVPTS